MCKACYSDPAWNEIHYKRQGAVDSEDFYVEVNYRPKKKDKKSKRYPGCSGNEGKAHIYVWTTENNKPTLFFDHYGFHKREKKVCAGCGHIDKTRQTEQYRERNRKEKDKAARRGKRTYKYWFFEDYDEDFRQKRESYIEKRGWTDYVYSGWLL